MPDHLHNPTAEGTPGALAPGAQSRDAPLQKGGLRDARPSSVTIEDQPLAAARPKSRGLKRAKREALTLADYRAVAAFRQAVRKFLAFSESGAAAQAITPQQHQALLAIKAHDGEEPMSVSELAASLLIKTHSAVGLVARLVDRGLVERQASERDRRRILLSLTRAGERVLETLTRKNLGKLKTTTPVFIDLLNALEHLDLPSPAEGEIAGEADD